MTLPVEHAGGSEDGLLTFGSSDEATGLTGGGNGNAKDDERDSPLSKSAREDETSAGVRSFFVFAVHRGVEPMEILQMMMITTTRVAPADARPGYYCVDNQQSCASPHSLVTKHQITKQPLNASSTSHMLDSFRKWLEWSALLGQVSMLMQLIQGR